MIVAVNEGLALANAWARSRTEDVTILVDRPIQVAGLAQEIGWSGRLRVIGTNRNAWLDGSGLRFGGWPEDGSVPPGKHGVTVAGPEVTFINVGFENFDYRGIMLAAINPASRINLINCRGRDCFNLRRPTRITPARSSSDVASGSVFCGAAHWRCINVSVHNCCRASTYCHAFYLSGTVQVVGANVRGCGGPVFRVGYRDGDPPAEIIGCSISDPRTAMHVSGTPLYPWPFEIDPLSPVRIERCRVRGRYAGILDGQPHADSIFAANDWSGLITKQPDPKQLHVGYWHDYIAGKRHTEADWWLRWGQWDRRPANRSENKCTS